MKFLSLVQKSHIIEAETRIHLQAGHPGEVDQMQKLLDIISNFISATDHLVNNFDPHTWDRLAPQFYAILHAEKKGPGDTEKA